MGTCFSRQVSHPGEYAKYNLTGLAAATGNDQNTKEATAIAATLSATLSSNPITCVQSIKWFSSGRTELRQYCPLEIMKQDDCSSHELTVEELSQCIPSDGPVRTLDASVESDLIVCTDAVPDTGAATAVSEATGSVKQESVPPKGTLSRPRPTVTIYTEIDYDNDDGALSLGQQGEGGKFSQTPIVAVLPFAARDSRMLTASMFKERYGSCVDDALEMNTDIKTNDVSTSTTAQSPKLAKSPKAGKRKSFLSIFGSNSDLREKEEKEKNKDKKDKKDKNQSMKSSPLVASSKPRVMSREQSIRIGSDRLQRRVDKLNLLQHRVKDDGNCQFRAIAQQLLGSEEYHDIVRVHIVTYMIGVRDRFDCYFESKQCADAYYSELLKNGVWGDELTLRGASDSLFVNIHLLSSEQHNFYITYRPSADAPPPPAFLVDVARLNEQNRTRCGAQSTPSANIPLAVLVPERPTRGSSSPRGEERMDLTKSFSTAGASSPPQSPLGGAALSSGPSARSLRGGAAGGRDEAGAAARGREESPENDAVDANALQRRLQQKLSVSMILPAMDPVRGDMHGKSSVRDHSAVENRNPHARAMHARTVSQDITKFWAVGAEMVKATEPKTLRFPVLQTPTLACKATTPALQGFSSLVSVSSTASKNKGKGAETNSSPEKVRQHCMGSESSSSHSMTSPSLTGKNDTKFCLAFEPRTEPVDIFLSYLFPVHYNALSLSEDEGNSSQNNNSSNAKHNGSMRSTTELCEQVQSEVASRTQSTFLFDCVGAPFLKRVDDLSLRPLEKSAL